MTPTPTPTPYVGMPATIRYFTDRRAGTVIHVSTTSHKIIVQEDSCTRTDLNGMSEDQEYSYSYDPGGRLHIFYKKDAGDYGRVTLGVRNTYHDYSF